MNSEKLRAMIASIEAGTWRLEEGTSVITDEQLDEWENGASAGHRNSVDSLRPLHPALRPLAVSEGTITMNMSPGWNFSGAVAYGAREIAAGRCEHIEMNRLVIENDPHGTKASAAAKAGVSHGEYLRQVTGRG